METVHTVVDLRDRIATWRKTGLRVALVPTMGSLHAGHLALVRHAGRHADRVVSSIFVNPLQFAEGEDYDRYPRTLEADATALAEAGNYLVFAPTVREVYPHGTPIATRVEVPGLSRILCGEFRPHHFGGVTTVVALLFNLVQPDVAVFGRKDYQQFTLIRRMVADLRMPVEVLGAPTVREPSGLAMSSRNRYLSETERGIAPNLHRTLRILAQRVVAGERDYGQLEHEGVYRLHDAGFQPDYVAVRRPDDLESPSASARAWVVLAAARLGRTRLIDNLVVGGDDPDVALQNRLDTLTTPNSSGSS